MKAEELSSPLLGKLCPATSHLDADRDKVDTKLDSLLMKLTYAKSWRRNVCSAEVYHTKLQQLLDGATEEMSRLSRDGRFDDCDDVVNCISKLNAALGEESFETVDIESFDREISPFGNHVLRAGQFFKPKILSEEDDSVLKLSFFFISEAETAEVRLKYYLEHTSLVDEYFALGLFGANGHVQVKIYGNSCPSYWAIRRHVLSDAHRRLMDEEVNANEPAMPGSSGP